MNQQGVTGNALYMWAWSFDINDANIVDCPTNGAWTASNEANHFTLQLVRILILKPLHQLLSIAEPGGRIGFFWSKPKTGDKNLKT
jgi:hypothetical protein